MNGVSREILAPTPNPETAAFWSAAGEGRLALRYCRSCGRHHHYPRAICPLCMSDATEWRAAAGGGRIHAWSVMRRAPVPYAVAYVELDEGPLMLTNIVNCDLDALRIGQRVTLAFQRFEGGALPVFEPAPEQAAEGADRS
ncbi:MAG TPA: OB-fold domain-containing protein [Zeimonas sp.]|nr:OB-fold domain-containing protein [Zeimonas sp.]